MIFNLETNKLEECYFRKVERAEIIENNYRPQGGWDFDWVKPISLSFEVYALVTKSFPEIVQGLIAVKPNFDEIFMCVDIDILESAPKNKKYNKKKLNTNRNYLNVGKCLVAFSCAYSVEVGLLGYVQLTSKTSKMKFYDELGAKTSWGQLMMFYDEDAKILIDEHLQGGIKWL